MDNKLYLGHRKYLIAVVYRKIVRLRIPSSSDAALGMTTYAAKQYV